VHQVAVDAVGPVLAEGQRNGEVRDDLEIDELIDFMVEQTFLAAEELDRSADEVRRRFRHFIIPALAATAITVFLPWTGSNEVATSLPATMIARFFGDSFERRTNQRLRAVAGDAQLATLISLDAGRPHLFLDAAPERTPWLTQAKFNETGGVVVWRASDTAGTPPDELAKRFPGIVPEIPRAFERLVTGRQGLLRIGWAIVRPKAP